MVGWQEGDREFGLLRRLRKAMPHRWCVLPATHVGEVDVGATAAGEVASEVVEHGVTPLTRLAEVGAALPAPPPAVLRHW